MYKNASLGTLSRDVVIGDHYINPLAELTNIAFALWAAQHTYNFTIRKNLIFSH